MADQPPKPEYGQPDSQRPAPDKPDSASQQPPKPKHDTPMAEHPDLQGARGPVPLPRPTSPQANPMPAPHHAEARPTISTHVLDAGRGAPQAGVLVRLSRLAGDGPATVLAELTTDDDGRIASLAPDGLTAGTYRLEFHLDGLGSDFFRAVQLDLRVDDPTRSYHVPLLVAPYGLSTYRGS